MRLAPNMIVYLLLFVVYVNNTQRNYLSERQRIDEDMNQPILIGEKIVLGIIGAIFIYGFIEYMLYKKKYMEVILVHLHL